MAVALAALVKPRGGVMVTGAGWVAIPFELVAVRFCTKKIWPAVPAAGVPVNVTPLGSAPVASVIAGVVPVVLMVNELAAPMEKVAVLALVNAGGWPNDTWTCVPVPSRRSMVCPAKSGVVNTGSISPLEATNVSPVRQAVHFLPFQSL
jgi:hypothetical protein